MAVEIARRFNIVESGQPDGQPMVFAHGFGCDQHMWRLVAPAFEDDFRVILFDHVGSGGSDPSAYDDERHRTLDGYAQDVLDIITGLDLRDVILVGHSVSSMIAALAAIAAPDRFAKLVFVSPSPRYIDDGPYVGGFTAEDIQDMLSSLDGNYLGWSSAMAPAIMGNADRPELTAELEESFCRVDPRIAARFARATFLSDSRSDLPRVQVPTLILQCTDDAIAPVAVGEFVRDAMPDARLVLLRATGHCPHLSEPAATTAAIASFARPGAPASL
ncbi:MAG: Carboxylesterase bioH [Pseudonocardiales bacterium]|nr:Carboxylesterase bioH [Jatrophihabitantaceae bacterium]MCW2603190.1 Carboxylesterase bioH [Pseudonocardiales bacterium]